VPEVSDICEDCSYSVMLLLCMEEVSDIYVQSNYLLFFLQMALYVNMASATDVSQL
jgi:hypothetical protein